MASSMSRTPTLYVVVEGRRNQKPWAFSWCRIPIIYC